MTTMIYPRGQRISSTRTSQRGPLVTPVPPAATWNGGLDQRPVSVRTHVSATQYRKHPDKSLKSPRMRKQRYRDAVGQFALGGVLGLTAVIGMLAVNGTAEEDVVGPTTISVATMDVK
ncbi:hypothetical protein CKALI_06705 [Corynebacterium kalinowskii]|uniref:Uncharacterized protein n=1 Tax=Corynebacterium kalinowskii TaxID=2675216 RepID=A0A6B8VDE8_9CORY|nr:hypothetical protein [Corynebacterium kalinowskii]QGU02203.1 hypothetical protein CKALI_06705 [Corynebacterium kalinowskii]